MARQIAPETRVGGGMAPQAVESLTRKKIATENRMLEAMRQAGAGERGKLQAQTQFKTAQIGAEERAGSARYVAATQAETASRLSADTRRNAYYEREHEKDLEIMRARHTSEALKLEDKLHREWTDEYIVPQIKDANIQAGIRNTALMGTLGEIVRGIFGLVKLNMKSEGDRQAATIKYNQMVDTTTKESEMYERTLGEATDSLGLDDDMINISDIDLESGIPFSWKKAVGRELQKNNITNISVNMLTPANKAGNAKSIADGEIRKSDVQGMYRILSAAEKVTVDRLNDIKPDGEDKYETEEDINLKWHEMLFTPTYVYKLGKMGLRKAFQKPEQRQKSKWTEKGFVYPARPKHQRLKPKDPEYLFMKKQLKEIKAAKISLENLQYVDMPMKVKAEVRGKTIKNPTVGQATSDWLNVPMGRSLPLLSAGLAEIDGRDLDEKLDFVMKASKGLAQYPVDVDTLRETFPGITDEQISMIKAQKKAFEKGVVEEEPEEVEEFQGLPILGGRLPGEGGEETAYLHRLLWGS